MNFGNPSQQHIELIQNSILVHEWESAGILEPLKRYPYPCETTTYGELQALVSLMDQTSPERIEHCNVVDDYLFDVWALYAESLGVTITGDQLYQWVMPYEPVIDYLKLYYNRPRPFQTAYAMNIPLYPRVKSGSTDSSYPSGHTLFSCWIAHALTARYPQYKSDWWWMVMDIKRTREELGVHYPSDGLFALRVYKELKHLWKI